MQNQTVSGSVSKRGRGVAALATVASALVGSEGPEATLVEGETQPEAQADSAAPAEATEAAAPKRTVEEQYLENQAAIDAAKAVLAAAEAKQTDLANRCKAGKLTQLTLGGRKCQVRKESEKKDAKSSNPNHYFHFIEPREAASVKDASTICV